jgi:phosphopentomutase
MIEKRRVILIILDGVGIGELPDAELYNDTGSNTIVNTARIVKGLHLLNLQRLGLGNITKIKGVLSHSNAIGNWGKAAEISAGKDSTSGHWEIMGILAEKSFPTYPNGFPKQIIDEFIVKTGCNGILGNKAASGTVIINELGEEHLKTKYPIIYTSADSVFQIACHEDIYSVKELYKMCEIARNDILVGEHKVGRVIARPFIGAKNGNFVRTPRRKDFSVNPPEKSVLDTLKENKHNVIGIGKIEDLFSFQGLTDSVHTHHNDEAMEAILNKMSKVEEGLIFANLPDFDTLWGHRNNFSAFAKGLENFDEWLPDIMKMMKPNDILIITADHGCDPTTESTDHSREYIPLIVYGESMKKGVNLGIRKTFADIGATISEIFQVPLPKIGKSFLKDIKN